MKELCRIHSRCRGLGCSRCRIIKLVDFKEDNRKDTEFHEYGFKHQSIVYRKLSPAFGCCPSFVILRKIYLWQADGVQPLPKMVPTPPAPLPPPPN